LSASFNLFASLLFIIPDLSTIPANFSDFLALKGLGVASLILFNGLKG